MLLWRVNGCVPAIGRQGCIAAWLAAAAVFLLAVSPTQAAADDNKDPQDRQAQKSEKEPTAQQGTAVLGVVIGKPRDAEVAEVIRVWPESPAAKAGIERGDRIVRIGDDEVTSPESLRAAVLKRAPGEKVELQIVRNGESQKVEARLGGTDDAPGWARCRAIPLAPERTAWLGVRIAPARSAEQRGVLLRRVFPGTPAAEAGLKGGDAILRVDKTRVEAAADLQAAIAAHLPGETVKLVIRRDGKQQSIEVKLGTFADWQAHIGNLTEEEIRDVLRGVVTAPFGLVEEALPDQPKDRTKPKEQISLPKLGVAKLSPTKGNDVRGIVVLKQKEDGLHFSGKVRGLKPGLHGFHIHEYGDLRGPAGKAAGGHFNPSQTKHGGPEDEEHHAGDLGNIEAGDDGVAAIDMTAPWLKLHFVLGRALVVHEGEDDLKTQPTGDAGPRVAIGVIGIAQPPKAKGKQQ